MAGHSDPVELADIIARRLSLTGALGTIAETHNGVYTGRLVSDVLHGQAKAIAVRELALREGLDLARCAAYSDSINDVPMLSMVGHPVAVNPDSALRSEARARGWEVCDFRTGRRAARIGVPAALGVSAVAGGVGAALAVRRARRRAVGASALLSALGVPQIGSHGARRALTATRNVAARAGGTASTGSSRVPGR